MNKNCPNCRKNFGCHEDRDCWCEDLQIHKREMLVVMSEWDDCLCPECLGKFSEQ